jgi:hypothetical protein
MHLDRPPDASASIACPRADPGFFTPVTRGIQARHRSGHRIPLRIMMTIMMRPPVGAGREGRYSGRGESPPLIKLPKQKGVRKMGDKKVSISKAAIPEPAAPLRVISGRAPAGARIGAFVRGRNQSDSRITATQGRRRVRSNQPQNLICWFASRTAVRNRVPRPNNIKKPAGEAHGTNGNVPIPDLRDGAL